MKPLEGSRDTPAGAGGLQALPDAARTASALCTSRGAPGAPVRDPEGALECLADPSAAWAASRRSSAGAQQATGTLRQRLRGASA